MTQTHTPGPALSDLMAELRALEHSDFNMRVRETCGRAGDCISILTRSNAELLDALQGLMRWCAGDVLDLPEVNAARAAIAKAEGEG